MDNWSLGAWKMSNHVLYRNPGLPADMLVISRQREFAKVCSSGVGSVSSDRVVQARSAECFVGHTAMVNEKIGQNRPKTPVHFRFRGCF